MMPEEEDKKMPGEVVLLDKKVIESLTTSVQSIEQNSKLTHEIVIDVKVNQEKIITLFKRVDENKKNIEKTDDKIDEHLIGHDEVKSKMFDRIVNTLIITGILAGFTWFKDEISAIVRYFK
jgi:N-acetylglucosamine kinase-like BadF-type ATPase